MIFPPSTLRIKIIENHQKKVNLWLPLFILWPIVLLIMIPIMIMALPFLLVAGLVIPLMVIRIIKLGPALISIFCSMRGLKVDVQSKDSNVYISMN